jgi:CBS domain-containing protein
MAMLSELLRFDVVDEAGRKARFADMALALLEDDYPPVTAVHFHSPEGVRRLEWKDVIEVDRQNRRIEVRDLERAKLAGDEDRPGEVLLKRDVLDALIIDLLQRRTTRSCDLLLSVAEGEMRLRAVDAGLGAMLRRISHGLYKRVRKSDMYDWRYVEFLRGDPTAVDSGAGYRLRIGRLPAGEIAQIADYIPYLHAAELLTLLPNEKAALALQAMSLERQIQVIEEFDDDEAVDLITRMSPDRATDLVGSLGVEKMKQILGLMPKKQRERIIELLRYPETSVGGVMINNIVFFGAGTSAKTARDSMRKHSKEVDFISIIFVTESSTNNVLIGSLTIRELIDAPDDAKLKDVMDPYLATLSPFDPALDAAHKLIGSQVAAMPVTNAESILIGAMTIEAAIGQAVAPGSGLRGLKVFS